MAPTWSTMMLTEWATMSWSSRDPRPLLRDRDACARLALALGLGGAFLGRFGLLGSLAQDVARDPATTKRGE